MREADNIVNIIGILSENNLEESNYKGKDGETVECVRGELIVKTEQTLNNEKKIIEVPVKFFANKYKKNSRDINKIYTSLIDVKNNFKSIAAVGEENADRIRISNAKIKMNEFPNRNGEITSYPQIQGTFVNKIKKEECVPEATFQIEFLFANGDYEVDKEGNETGKYLIKAIVPQYGNKVDVIPFKAINNSVIDAISSFWQNGDTVRATGRLNFSTEVITNVSEVGFGEKLEQTRTNKISELIITGGSEEPENEEQAFNIDEIKGCLNAREAELEKKKENAKKSTPAIPSQNSTLNDYGF